MKKQMFFWPEWYHSPNVTGAILCCSCIYLHLRKFSSVCSGPTPGSPLLTFSYTPQPASRETPVPKGFVFWMTGPKVTESQRSQRQIQAAFSHYPIAAFGVTGHSTNQQAPSGPSWEHRAQEVLESARDMCQVDEQREGAIHQNLE